MKLTGSMYSAFGLEKELEEEKIERKSTFRIYFNYISEVEEKFLLQKFLGLSYAE